MQLTEQIYRELFLDILKGVFQPGARFLTEQEACERFKTCRITVRRAYARLENEHIIIRRPKIGTVVNDQFAARGGNIQTVGVLAPMEDEFSRNFLETICNLASKRDVITVLEPARRGEQQNQAVQRLVRHGIRDIVVWGVDRGLDMSLFFRLRLLGVNLVFFDRIRPGAIADYVVLDNLAAMEALVDRAAESGARQIFFADTQKLDVDTSRERREACFRSCARRHLPCSDALPEKFPDESAVVCVNDPVAMSYCGCGVPVYSIDGSMPAVKTGIVTYPQPMEEMAEMCFKALQKQRANGQKWHAREFRIAGAGLKKGES